LGLVGHLRISVLPLSPANATTAAATAAPAAGTLLELSALPGLFAWLSLSFSGCTAGWLYPWYRRHCRTLLIALRASFRPAFRRTGGSATPSAAATALRALFSAIALLPVCEFFGIFLFFQEVRHVQERIALQPQFHER
jgi:hypothetical protein